MIRLGTPADLAAVTGVYRRASLSNPGDRDRLLAHPEYLVLEPAGLTEGRTHVAEENGAIVGFATWAEPDGTQPDGTAADGTPEDGTWADRSLELEDLFVDPRWMRRGVATSLVNRVVEVLRSRGARNLSVTANPDALGFYRSVGFVDDGVAETALRRAPRMLLTIG